MPQYTLTDGYSRQGGVNIIRSPTDAGPAKQRYRGNKAEVLSVSFAMTSAQVGIFETFVKSTLKGTARYGWTPPGYAAIQEVRVIPSDGNLYSISPTVSADTWIVAFQLEILP